VADTERHDRLRATTLSFIVRLSVESSGEVTGVVERVATGEKVRFVGYEGVSPVIAKLVAGEKTL